MESLAGGLASCGLMFSLFISSQSSAQEIPPLGKGPNASYKISVPVDLVVLPVTVLDHRGHFVSGLSKEDFRVSENGQPQPIRNLLHEDIPVTVGLALDNSGSMRPKSSEVNAAALVFAESSNPLDEMFVVKFNEKVTMGLPDGVPFTSNREQLEIALVRNPPRGRTALYDATIAALEHMKFGIRGKRVLLIVSDGGDNSSQNNFSQVVESAKRSNAVIYTIGLYDVLEKDRNLAVLGRLARLTGGEAFLPETIDKAQSICQRIARDIRNQYTLEYVPSDRRHDGTYRSIQVTVSSPQYKKLTVLTRTGYYAPFDDSQSPSGQSTETPDKEGSEP
jgi:Ca-activated chloride channel homolog